MKFDLKTLAKYPFLGDAKSFVDSLDLSLEDIQNHPLYSASIDLGRQRVFDAIQKSIKPSFDERVDIELTILSYPIARILANLTDNRSIIQSYATGEAESAYNFIKNEEGSIIQGIKDDLGFSIKDNKIPFTTYVSLATNLSKRDSRWRLVNRIVNSGFVNLEEGDENLLLREAIRLKTIGTVDTKHVSENFKKIAKGIKSTILGQERRDLRVSRVEMDRLPPCVKNMLVSLKAGDMTHNMMFILGTFFVNLGLKSDDIVRIFSEYPKFSEDKTRYQLRFLSGEKGSTRYSCPSCSKIKSYGLCRWNCRVKHPLQFYRKRR